MSISRRAPEDGVKLSPPAGRVNARAGAPGLKFAAYQRRLHYDRRRRLVALIEGRRTPRRFGEFRRRSH